jgi:hypothetical protein
MRTPIGIAMPPFLALAGPGSSRKPTFPDVLASVRAVKA